MNDISKLMSIIIALVSEQLSIRCVKLTTRAQDRRISLQTFSQVNSIYLEIRETFLTTIIMARQCNKMKNCTAEYKRSVFVTSDSHGKRATSSMY